MQNPNIPPPTSTPFVPEEPGTQRQVGTYGLDLYLTTEKPIGTVLSQPITESSFFVKVRLEMRGLSLSALSRGFHYAEWVSSPSNYITLSVTGTTLTLINSNVVPIPVASSQWGSTGNYHEFSVPINFSGYGVGTLNLDFTNHGFNWIGGYRMGSTAVQSGNAISIDIARSPIVVIGQAEDTDGNALPDLITSTTSFFIDFTWDLPTSASFTNSDLSVTSSNSNMSGSLGTLTNVGTAGTSTHYRVELTVTGTGLTTLTVTVAQGAIPAAGRNLASNEVSRSYEVNTNPSPVATFSRDATDSAGMILTQPITATEFYVVISWSLNVGDEFTIADVNAISTNSDLNVSIDSMTEITQGRSWRLNVVLSGGDSAIVTLYTNLGAIPAGPTTGASSDVARESFNVALPPLPPAEGTMSGPTITQSGGAVLLKPDDVTDVDAPILEIEVTNLEEVKMSSNVPVNIGISFIFDKIVTGFSQATPNYHFIPRDTEQGDPTKVPQLGTFSGTDGNATYEQLIEIQPDSAGKINIAVPANSSESVEDEEIYGPSPPGVNTEIFYDTTIAGNPAPTVNISTPPTTFFKGTTFTTTFKWDQPIEKGTFRTTQIFIEGATAGPLVTDSVLRDEFTMQLTLPEVGRGRVTVSVLSHRVVSTAALGIISRRQGPESTTAETFHYDQGFSTPTPVVTGANTICEITETIRRNPNLDQVLTPIPYGGAFAGVSDVVYIEDEDTKTPYVYCIVQMIKRRPGTTSDLSNLTEAGAFLLEVNLQTNRCRTVRQWAYTTIAARSLVSHKGQLYWIEGSHYGNRRRRVVASTTPDVDGNLPVAYPETMGNVMSLMPGGNTPFNHGVNWRSQFSYPEEDVVIPDYGFHTQTASPLVSDGESLYMVTGFGGLSNITSRQFATSRRIGRGVEPATDIRNWNLIKYTNEIAQRISRFDTNGTKGWDILRDLAIFTNSFIGVDKNGSFYFTPKGGVTAEVQSSAPSTLEFKNPTAKFPQEGILEVDGEVLTYNGIIGSQFLRLNRGQYGTDVGDPTTGDTIRLIKSVLNTNQPVFDPVHNADIRDQERQLFNKIIIKYAGSIFEMQDDDSIEMFGERIYEMELPLTIHQTQWLEEIARRFLDEYKRMHYLVNVTMKEDYDIDVTDVVFLQVPERSYLNQPCQIYEATRNPRTREVELLLRTL